MRGRRAETTSKGSRAEEWRREMMKDDKNMPSRGLERRDRTTFERRLLSVSLAVGDRGHSRSRQVHNT